MRPLGLPPAIHEQFPGKMLAYNCSPSFNWKKHLDEATIASFQKELGALGYKFQFITLAGFHSLNASMFELASGYAVRGMPPTSSCRSGSSPLSSPVTRPPAISAKSAPDTSTKCPRFSVEARPPPWP